MTGLKFIYDKLKAGEIFGVIEPHRLGGTYFWEVLLIDNGFIKWRNYGQSASKVSLSNLKWILEVIFRMTPAEFLYNFTTYSKYVKIDECYDGYDRQTKDAR